MATGRIEQLDPGPGENNSFATGWWIIGDESSVLSAGGGILYNTHQAQPSGYDMGTGTAFPLPGARDTWGGHFRPVWAANEWHGSARGAISIAGNRYYWIVGSRVIAVEGQ